MADCFHPIVGGLRVHGDHTRVRLNYANDRVEYVRLSSRSRGRDSWTLKKLEKLAREGVKMSIAVVDGHDAIPLSPWFDFDPKSARGGSSPWRRLTGRDADLTNVPSVVPAWRSEGVANARVSFDEWVDGDGSGFPADEGLQFVRARHRQLLTLAVEGLSYGKSAGVRGGNARQLQWILEQENGEQTLVDTLLTDEDQDESHRHRAMLVYRALVDLNVVGGSGILDDHPELCAAILDSSGSLLAQIDGGRYGVDREFAEDIYDDALSSVLAISSRLERAPSDDELAKSVGGDSRKFTRLVRKALDEEPVLGGLLVPAGSAVRIDARRALYGDRDRVGEFVLVPGPAADNGSNIVNVGGIRRLFAGAENVTVHVHGVAVTIPSAMAGSRSPQTLGRILSSVRDEHGAAAAATVAAGQLLEVLAGGVNGSDDRRRAMRRVEVLQRLGFSMDAATGARWRMEDRRIEALGSFLPEGFPTAVDSLFGSGRLSASRNQSGADVVNADIERLRLPGDAIAVMEGRLPGDPPVVDGAPANVFTAHLSASTAPVAGPAQRTSGNISVDDHARVDRIRKLARESDWATALADDPAAVLACPEAVQTLSPEAWMAAYRSTVDGVQTGIENEDGDRLPPREYASQKEAAATDRRDLFAMDGPGWILDRLVESNQQALDEIEAYRKSDFISHETEGRIKSDNRVLAAEHLRSIKKAVAALEVVASGDTRNFRGVLEDLGHAQGNLVDLRESDWFNVVNIRSVRSEVHSYLVSATLTLRRLERAPGKDS